MAEYHVLAGRQRTKILHEALIAGGANDFQAHVRSRRFDQDVNAFVRQQATDEEYRIALYVLHRRRKLPDIDATQYHVRPLVRAVDTPAVLTDMEAAVVPTIASHVAGNIPSASAQRRREHTAAAEPTDARRQRADENVLLVAMHHVGASNF